MLLKIKNVMIIVYMLVNLKLNKWVKALMSSKTYIYYTSSLFLLVQCRSLEALLVYIVNLF